MWKGHMPSKLPTLHKHLWYSASMLAYLKAKLPFFISLHQEWFLDLRLFALENEFSLPLQGMTALYNGLWNANGTKNSPVMNYEAISYEEQCYIYLPTLHAGGDSRKKDFPGSCAKMKRPSASYPFHLFRWGNNAPGDNNIVTIIQSTSTCIIRCAPPRNPAWGGSYEYYRVQKREWMKKFKLYAPGHPDRE